MENLRELARESDQTVKPAPDPTWKGLYTAGGIAALLYVVLAIVVPIVMILAVRYDFKLAGAALLRFIAGHRAWWMVLQGLVLESSVLLVITLIALYAGLKHLNKSAAAIGAAVGATSQILFMAYYPVLLGLVYLSDRFAESGAARSSVFSTAAEALIAQNGAFNPVYEPLFAAGILVLSIVMVRGAFHRGVAYLGIAAAAAVVVAMALFPLIGLAYLFWWVAMTAWLLAAAWMLYRWGRP